MFEKLTILFVATFIIALAFFSSYFVIQEIRGAVNIGGILEMNNQSIFDLPLPTVASDLVTKEYLKKVRKLYIGVDNIESWCEVQYFNWCSGGYPEPPPSCSCSGSAFACYNYDSGECDVHPNCYWTGTKCGGVPVACSYFNDYEWGCKGHLGCSWVCP